MARPKGSKNVAPAKKAKAVKESDSSFQCEEVKKFQDFYADLSRKYSAILLKQFLKLDKELHKKMQKGK